MVPGVRLILVRHGQSEWNVLGRLQGVSDPPLSPAGRAEARELGAFVRALGAEVAVSSDLLRARETLALMDLGIDPLPPDPLWREADLGDWTGRLPAELSPGEHAAFLRWRVGRATPPRGEGWEDTRARTARAVRALEATGAERAVAVTHGGPVRALCHELVGLDPEVIVPVGNATVTILEVGPLPRLLGFGMAPAEPRTGSSRE